MEGVDRLKVLVTGASGFLGRYICSELIRRGHDVIAGVRPSSDVSFLKGNGIGLRHFDLTDKDSMPTAVRGTDAVVHLAAHYTFAGRSEDYRRLNVQATADLADAALSEGVGRLIYCSSTEAMGPSVGTADESSELRPEYAYGRSKVEAEKELAKRAKAGLDHVVLRPSGVYGPHNIDDVSYWFITSYGKRLATRFVIGDGSRRIQFVHAKDVAKAFGLALEACRSKGQTYIVSEGRSYSYGEVYSMLGEISGIPPPKVHLPPLAAKALIAPVQLLNWISGREDFMYRISTVDSVMSDRSYSIEKARREIGYEPEYDLRRGLRETYEWYRMNGLL